MDPKVLTQEAARELVLLGDEAVAMGAIDAGVSACYGYPGTPSTEILEAVLRYASHEGHPKAAWCANEKTAYEAALGVSMIGRRALVAMKHVGLNVAADPFMNSAIVSINGGLVVAVADDPGMHSSQNEQDSRCLADFARVPCLEPTDQQQAYEMTREAFELSERFEVPVLIRLVTRLAHSRAAVRLSEGVAASKPGKPAERTSWILLPAYARRQWRELLDCQPQMRAWSDQSPHNLLRLHSQSRELGVITTGIARNYFLESLAELEPRPSHLQIGAYPLPLEKIRTLAASVDRLLILEEGYPYLERYLRGILPTRLEIRGKESGELPLHGELNPDLVRRALGLDARQGIASIPLSLAQRPPQLCAGCPHADTYQALQQALSDFEEPLVTADIGCYTLGALPPYSTIESCVCMGASVGMAKGAAEAGFYPVVAVIGDSTFLHSGIPPLMDAVAADADMTLLILDNDVVAMTGGQPTLLPSLKWQQLILGLGVDPDHFHILEAHPRKTAALAETIGREMRHRGLSVIVAARECIEAAKKRKRREKVMGEGR